VVSILNNKKKKFESPIKKFIFWFFVQNGVTYLYLLFVNIFIPHSNRDTISIVLKFIIPVFVLWTPWLYSLLVYSEKIKKAEIIQEIMNEYLEYPVSTITIIEYKLNFKQVADAAVDLNTFRMTDTTGRIYHIDDFISHSK
jgi:hypothetical protein